MRKEIFRMSPNDAAHMLAAAPSVHFATVNHLGEPLLRVVNAVVVESALYFHGARAGEKLEALGRPVVVSVEEVVASIPSTFVHPELACPATTLYRSVQVHGVIEEATDHETKVRTLSALLEKLQPEGGYLPLEKAPARYAPVIRGLLVARVRLDRVDGKAKLGQNRSSAEVARMLQGMWQRGAAGDVRAIELVRAANPGADVPAFLADLEPSGPLTFHVHGDTHDAHEVATMMRDASWNVGVEPEVTARAHRASSAWVFARDRESRRIVGSARAISDSAKRAWIYDVFVEEGHRDGRVGSRLMKLLLDHPAVRGAGRVHLTTRTAEAFYRSAGFRDAREVLSARSELVVVR